MNAMNQEAAHIRAYLKRTNISQENRGRAEVWLAGYEATHPQKTHPQKRHRGNNGNGNNKVPKTAKKKRSCRKTLRRR
jgi:hypothetical protein